jgi:hypothetical protein
LTIAKDFDDGIRDRLQQRQKNLSESDIQKQITFEKNKVLRQARRTFRVFCKEEENITVLLAEVPIRQIQPPWQKAWDDFAVYDDELIISDILGKRLWNP